MTHISRILLVDDSEDGREIGVAVLAEGDFDQIDAADSAEQAYAMLELEQDDPELPPTYDLILLDIVMPQVDGIEACARIRTTRRYRDVPILMLSRLADIEILNQAFVAGANDYVTKPIKQIELLSRVRSALRLKRELDRRKARETELRAQVRTARAGGGGYCIDDTVGLVDRHALDAHVRAIADGHEGAAVLVVSIDAYEDYVGARGEAEGDRLVKRLALTLGELPAPLGTTFGRYGPGLMMVVAPHAADRLEPLADEVVRAVDALRLPHGSSADNDNVRVRVATGAAQDEALLRLPSRLIDAIDNGPRQADGRIIRLGKDL